MMNADNIESEFQEFETYDTLSDKDIFTMIWTEPRRVIIIGPIVIIAFIFYGL